MTSNRSSDRASATAHDPFAISRVFDAPRALVFKAWTEPERLAQWWGPKGFAMTVARIDLRVGGTFLYSMKTEGFERWGKFVYREILASERLAFVVSFSDAAGGITRAPFSATWPLEVLSTVTFTETAGKTTMAMTGVPINATAEERRALFGGHGSMQQGWTGTMDQLAAYLAAR
jgi:uncharacterized protein YndB with AHSA1/START domain